MKTQETLIYHVLATIALTLFFICVKFRVVDSIVLSLAITTTLFGRTEAYKISYSGYFTKPKMIECVAYGMYIYAANFIIALYATNIIFENRMSSRRNY